MTISMEKFRIDQVFFIFPSLLIIFDDLKWFPRKKIFFHFFRKNQLTPPLWFFRVSQLLCNKNRSKCRQIFFRSFLIDSWEVLLSEKHHFRVHLWRKFLCNTRWEKFWVTLKIDFSKFWPVFFAPRKKWSSQKLLHFSWGIQWHIVVENLI